MIPSKSRRSGLANFSAKTFIDFGDVNCSNTLVLKSKWILEVWKATVAFFANRTAVFDASEVIKCVRCNSRRPPSGCAKTASRALPREFSTMDPFEYFRMETIDRYIKWSMILLRKKFQRTKIISLSYDFGRDRITAFSRRLLDVLHNTMLTVDKFIFKYFIFIY